MSDSDVASTIEDEEFIRAYCGPRLPREFKGELEVTRCVGRGWLPGRAGGAGCWVAKLVDGGDVEAIEKIEAVGDQVQTEVFAERDTFGDAQIHLKEARRGEAVAAEIAVAPLFGRNSWKRERRTVVRQACAGDPEGNTGSEGRGGGTADGRARLGSAEVEARVLAGEEMEWPAGSQHDEERQGDD